MRVSTCPNWAAMTPVGVAVIARCEAWVCRSTMNVAGGVMCAASRCSLFSKRRCHVSQESPSNGRPYHHPCGPNLRKDRGWMAAPEGFPATSARYGTRCHSSSLWRAAASSIFCTFCSATSGRGQSTLQADAARPRNGLPKRPFFNACASRGCSPWRRWTASISGSWRLRRSTAWPEIDLADETDLRRPPRDAIPSAFPD
jgi:hypothetical protein